MTNVNLPDPQHPCLIYQSDATDFFRQLPDNSVDLVIGSPPYAMKAHRYGEKKKISCPEWVEWMLEVTTEAVRVCRGDVIWVANGTIKDGQYHPACEGLIWSWYQQGKGVDRPCIWHKNAAPNRRDWFSNDWEFIMCFKSKFSVRKTFNWQEVAEPPKYASGGRFRQRDQNGERRLGGEYPQNKLAKPRDVFRVTVGGGHMGSPLAHQNAAPYPEKLVEPFIKVLSNPGDVVSDPFLGSGSTAKTAVKLGRLFVGCDAMQSQVELSQLRMLEI